MIKKEDRSFGPFGTGVEPVHKSRKRRRRSVIFFFFLMAILVPGLIIAWKTVHENFLEKSPPVITILETPEGVGSEPVKFDVEFVDDLSGLSEILVRYEQNRRIVNLKKIKLDQRKVRKRTIPISINGKELGLLPGKVKFSFVGFDKSFWSNSRRVDLFLDVDFTPPELEIVTTEHNARKGGVELVFYRVKGGALSGDFGPGPNRDSSVSKFVGFSGVKMSTWLFPGFPAHTLDTVFEAYPDLYFSLFPVPLDFEASRGSAVIFARDGVGNVNTKRLPLKIGSSKAKRVTYELDLHTLETQAAALWPSYEALVEGADVSFSEPKDINDLLKRYREFNVRFRKEVDERIGKLLSKPRMTKYWRGRLGRQTGYTQVYGYNETQNFEFEGSGAGVVISGGVGYSSLKERPVRAANNGVVVFCGELGPLGTSVILDHGFGLSSLYGNLSECISREGTLANANDVIGKSGRSGLNHFSGVHFEVRVQGLPVNPEEWWDRRWIRDHLDKKVEKVKRDLGLPVIKSIR